MRPGRSLCVRDSRRAGQPQTRTDRASASPLGTEAGALAFVYVVVGPSSRARMAIYCYLMEISLRLSGLVRPLRAKLLARNAKRPTEARPTSAVDLGGISLPLDALDRGDVQPSRLSNLPVLSPARTCSWEGHQPCLLFEGARADAIAPEARRAGCVGLEIPRTLPLAPIQRYRLQRGSTIPYG